ncbi:MAG: hypothetical protein ABGW97_03025 [Christiangramia sp.]|uniref:hypothetical protein n=1 Tax=Christiangramia sp. TaxID=1931228 RepID=UPI003242BF42
MDIRLFINDFLVDLNPGQKIGYTKQVNTISSMSDRQANMSKSFKVPKTARNIRYFEGLGITGSNTDLPYRKSTARLFVRNLCLIYKGWANFIEVTEDSFEISIYDGNIDFFKLLDNLKFDQIPLPEIEHLKTVDSVSSAWNNIQEYNYFVADYNGKTFYQNNGQTYLNIDYMVPSVQCKYLWNKIFEYLGFEFEMQAYTDYQFTDNYLTYPKGVRSGEVGEKYFSIDFENQKMISWWPYVNWLIWPDKFTYETEVLQGQIVSNSQAPDLKLWEVPETGFYELRVTGTLKSKAKKGVPSFFYYGRNLHNVRIQDYHPSLEQVRSEGLLIAEGNEDNFEKVFPLQLNAGDTITFIYDKIKMVQSDNSELNFTADISWIEQTQIGQGDFFKGLSVKDFFKEMLWKFGLTPYTVKDADKIDFLTWDERINGEMEDWSDRFQGKLSEKFVNGSYAKNNYFRFKYSDEAEDFNDGVFIIENENLDEARDLIKSKTYSREKDLFNFPVPSDSNSTRLVPKLKLWDQELKTDSNGDPVIEYKALDSRYIFVHKITLTKTNTRIGSEQLGVIGSTDKLDFATTRSDDSMQRVIRDYYSPFLTLMHKTKVIKAEFLMNVFEFDAFDLKPRIYVEQLGGEFIVDSLTKNDLSGKFVTAELIKINR